MKIKMRIRLLNSCLLLFSRVQLFATPWDYSPPGFPVLQISPRSCSDSCPLSQWLPPNRLILLPPSPFAFNLSQHQVLFPVSWLFASGGQSIEASASASVLLMISQGWFPLGLIGLISLLSKGLSLVFSSTTIQTHQFFGAQVSLWPNSHICTWLLEKL